MKPKHFLILLFYGLLLRISSYQGMAQTFQGTHPEVKDMKVYKSRGLGVNQVYLRMGYGKAIFENPKDYELCRGALIQSVDLVYTDYPPRTDLSRLNEQRFSELKKLAPGLFKNPKIRWRIIRQTDCQSEDKAKTMIHGFVITFKAGSGPDEKETLVDIVEKRKAPRDSTVLKVLNRHQEWKDMLVICDVTGSMAPYTGQVLLWFNMNLNDKRVRNFVFFNDGDSTPDLMKKIGSTGGIYDTIAESLSGVMASALKTMKKGDGGDIPENNVEALLYGNRRYPSCKEVIMIADNEATPRDMRLSHNVKKPVKIILCGTRAGINPAYLDLAKITGGSVHTIEEDIVNLGPVKEGDIIHIGNETFKYTSGSFERYGVSKKKKPGL